MSDVELLEVTNRAARVTKRLQTERDAALRNVENLTTQNDELRAALARVQAALAKEQAATHQSMRRALELYRTVRQYNAAMRCALSPSQWLAAVEEAKYQHPDLWRGGDELP